MLVGPLEYTIIDYIINVLLKISSVFVVDVMYFIGDYIVNILSVQP